MLGHIACSQANCNHQDPNQQHCPSEGAQDRFGRRPVGYSYWSKYPFGPSAPIREPSKGLYPYTANEPKPYPPGAIGDKSGPTRGAEKRNDKEGSVWNQYPNDQIEGERMSTPIAFHIQSQVGPLSPLVPSVATANESESTCRRTLKGRIRLRAGAGGFYHCNCISPQHIVQRRR